MTVDVQNLWTIDVETQFDVVGTVDDRFVGPGTVS
jgi:hypothetical protein